ncbi:hypothetical protein [Nocardiopsis halophila]|uniref:hypothetical protein n=1 Tax=Nocardiopsis halophila TaxID=141692 RepID=UPI00035D7AB2|nr:hypothetical protein [Nocardiopsis halophila]
MTALQGEAAAPGRTGSGWRRRSSEGLRRARVPARAAVPLAAAAAVAAGAAALVSAAEVITVLADVHVFIPVYGMADHGGARWDDPGLRAASAVLLLIGGGTVVAAGAWALRGGTDARTRLHAGDGGDPLPGVRKAIEESAVTVSGVDGVRVRFGARSVVVRVAVSSVRKESRRRAVEGAVRARLDSLSLGEEFTVRALVDAQDEPE